MKKATLLTSLLLAALLLSLFSAQLLGPAAASGRDGSLKAYPYPYPYPEVGVFLPQVHGDLGYVRPTPTPSPTPTPTPTPTTPPYP